MMWSDVICISTLLPLIWYIMTTSLTNDVDKTQSSHGPEYLIMGQELEDYEEKRVPFVVSIRSRTPRMYWGDNHFCGGIIISEEKVLTAAHCVVDYQKVLMRARRLMVVAGTMNRLRIEDSTRQLPVKDVKPHPLFLRFSTNDIAILILKTAFPDDISKIAPISISANPTPFGKEVKIYGWGRLFNKGPYATRMRMTNVILKPTNECRKLLPSMREGFICSYENTTQGKDPCRGDSGGPVVYQRKLIGVISWGLGCGNNHTPSLYVDIYSNYDWVMNHIGAVWSNVDQVQLITLTLLILTL